MTTLRKERALYLTASDVPVVLGVSPFCKDRNVVLRKKRKPSDEAAKPTLAQQIGHAVEPLLSMIMNEQYAIAGEQVFVVNEKIPLAATLDAVTKDNVILEYKSHGWVGEDYWPEDGTLPTYVLVQVLAQCLAADSRKAYVIEYSPRGLMQHEIVSEQYGDWNERIVEAAKEFDEKLLSGGWYPTEVDCPEEWAYLDADLVDRALEAAEYARYWKEQYDELRDRIVAQIGEARGGVDDAGRITKLVTVTRRIVSAGYLKDKYPSIYEECTVESVQRRLDLPK